MKVEYRTMMFIDGKEINPSCIKSGAKRDCERTAARLNSQKDKDPRIEWRVLPCVGVTAAQTKGPTA